MNKKSILYIFVVLIALSLTVGAVSAAVDASTEDVLSVYEGTGGDDGAIDDVGVGNENILGMSCAEYREYKNSYPPGYSENIKPYMVEPEEEYKKCFGDKSLDQLEMASANETADIAVDVQVLKETDFEIVWKISAFNKGPDVAKDTNVSFKLTDNMLLQDYFETTGKFCPKCGVWVIGDLAPDDVAFLLLDTIKVDCGSYGVDAFIYSESNDYNWSNNFACKIVDGESAAVSAASEKIMPVAGNPIAMALLALVTIVGSSFIRKF